MYTMYCSNHPYALMKLQTVRQTKSVAKFFDYCSTLPESRNLNLSNFLLKPVQRICKYPLLLREIIKHTDTTHEDYDNLVKALLKIEMVVTIVNEGARQTEAVHKMLELQNRFTQKMNIISPSRVIKKFGSLNLLCANGDRKQREVYLFNDMLMLAKSIGNDGEKLKVITTVPFDMILVNTPSDEPGKENLIEVVHISNSKFMLACDTAFNRGLWIKAFQEATDAYMTVRNSHKAGGGRCTSSSDSSRALKNFR